jgi:regulator of sigma E protease
MQFAALISINLAVFNLLPIPALDGGRFTFYLLEAVTRRRVSPRIEQWAHSLGFALLILLMIIVTVNDVMNPSELFK